MKQLLVIISFFIGCVIFGQENKTDSIDHKVRSIESNVALTESKFDWVELTGIATDGGGILKVWKEEDQMYKIYEEIGLSYGRIATTIYLDNGIPIKIIETEENFERTSNGLNYKVLDEVFKAVIYVVDWDNDESKVEKEGERVMSEGNCSTFEYEPIVERAKKATTE
ncbi:hypothetical protein POV27_07645 [Aureisphaera galaxeae]|uniref:hypothetical protein n=1 Tax=Aureisphaera galaxeae TaxID=1538023 RepID=UPI0023509D5E|nr:hypothetical protein [Aureisphaera galaxeae]MDC8003921.1 hypothetical protein [Aureisphaera galaxeae]